jgi:hypothetical protein
MWCRVALVRTDVLEAHIASIIRVTIGRTRKNVSSNKPKHAAHSTSLQHASFDVTANILRSLILVTLMMEVICSSKTLVLTRATGHHIPEDSILQ